MITGVRARAGQIRTPRTDKVGRIRIDRGQRNNGWRRSRCRRRGPGRFAAGILPTPTSGPNPLATASHGEKGSLFTCQRTSRPRRPESSTSLLQPPTQNHYDSGAWQFHRSSTFGTLSASSPWRYELSRRPTLVASASSTDLSSAVDGRSAAPNGPIS